MDGIDQDCNGVDSCTWYLDQDQDGYGNPLLSLEDCGSPSGYVNNALDCDDSDSGLSPSTLEVWYDGIDQNCDGNDSDQDGDGDPAFAMGGGDCDDINASI